MRTIHWLVAAVLALVLTGCASMQSGPSPESKAALAPTGKLRVAFSAAVIYGMKDSATGEVKGVAVDLGKELARRLDVPFEAVIYAVPPALVSGAKSGEWDIAFSAIAPARAAVMDFSAPYMEIEEGYLVRAGSSIATAADIDKPGVRIGVTAKSRGDFHLSRTLKNATLVRVKSFAELYALLGSAKVGVDAIATGKPGLYAAAAKEPGSRVLDGRMFVQPLAIGVLKGRPAAAAVYVDKFVEEAKAEGLVKAAIERHGLRGVVVAPLK